MALGSNHMTITTGANFIPELWSAEVLRATESSLVLADKVKRYDSMVQGKGDTIHVPELSNLTAYAKAASTQVTLNTVTEGVVDISIDQHYETSFLVEDILKVQSSVDLMREYTEKAGYSIRKKLDSSIAGLYSGLSQYVGDGSTDFTDANMVAAIQKLDAADAPEDGRVLAIKPAQKADISLIDKFVLRTGAGFGPADSPILNGPKGVNYWGDLYGIPVYFTTNLVTQAATPTVDHCLLFQKEAFALAVQQQPRTQTQYKQEYLANLVTVDVIFGFKELRDAFAVDFRCKS